MAKAKLETDYKDLSIRLYKRVSELETRCNELFFQVNEKIAKISELEAQIERLKGDLELWESGACRATNLDKCSVVKELKAQIEKMKNWCNCKNYQQCLIELAEQGKGMKPSECCVNCKKWEIKEK